MVSASASVSAAPLQGEPGQPPEELVADLRLGSLSALREF